MGIRDTADFLLGRGRDEAARLLQQADLYIQAYNRLPGRFVLPREHALLLPIIETYAHDLGGFVGFVRGVRDEMEKGSGGHSDLHQFYRTLQTRLTQQQRRERLTRAFMRATEIHGECESFAVRQAWLIGLEHLWAKRRLAYMDSVRKGMGTKRLSADQRAEVFTDFWHMIDDEIVSGEGLPAWK